jgi:hypothetical protein
MSAAAGEEGGGAAVPMQGPMPVERVKAANGLEKVVISLVEKRPSIPVLKTINPGFRNRD